MKDPDRELVETCQNPLSPGFDEAFAALYRKYKDRVFNTAFRITGDRDEAMDVVQETFVTVLRKLQGFRFRSLFSSWLYRVAVNLGIDRRRKLRDGPIALPMGGSSSGGDPGARETGRTFEAPGPGPVETHESRDRERVVMEGMQGLSLKLRTVLILRYMEGLSYEQIGQVLHVSTGTVKSRLNRAHRGIARRLEPVLGEVSRRGRGDDEREGEAVGASGSIDASGESESRQEEAQDEVKEEWDPHGVS